MNTAKEEVKSLLDKLPDECTLEDIQYHLYVVGKIQKGIDHAATEGTVSQDKVERKFNCIGQDIQTSIAQLERGEGIPMKQAMEMIRRGYEEGAEDE